MSNPNSTHDTIVQELLARDTSTSIIPEIENINILWTLDKFWKCLSTPLERDEEIEWLARRFLFSMQNASEDILNEIFFIEMIFRGDERLEELIDAHTHTPYEIMRIYTRLTNGRAFKDVQLYTLKDITKWLYRIRQRQRDLALVRDNVRFPQCSSA